MKEQASSEIIGSLALAFVFVGIAAVILVQLSSQYPPISAPNIQVDISMVNNTLIIKSAGGETNDGQYQFRVYENNAENISRSRNSFPTGSNETFYLAPSTNVRKVYVIYRDPKTSSEFVIASKNITSLE